MYDISIEKAFHARHSLVLAGTPEPSHHHDWLVKVSVAAEKLNDEGVVMDFAVLERLVEKVIETLRQAANLNDLEPFAENPSAERVAAYFYRQLQQELSKDVNLVKVTVLEAPGCQAGYSE